MTEKELISKLQELRQIKPGKDWAILTKTQILGEQREQFSLIEGLRLFFQFKLAKPAFASLIAVFILFGIFSFSQNSVPGDFLYSVKKIVERSQAVFVSEQEKPMFNLEITEKRLEELNKISQKNLVQNLPAAFKEYETAKTEAQKEVSNLIKNNPKEVTEIVRNVVPRMKEIQEKEGRVFAYLGLEQKGQESFSDKIIVEYLILDLGTRTLTPEQAELFKEAQEDFEVGNYSEALTKIWTLSQNE